MVGTFITPYLADKYSLRVLDLRPPTASGIEYIEGSISDPESLHRALEGCDTFVNLVMNGAQGGASTGQSVPLILSNYEVNTLACTSSFIRPRASASAEECTPAA